MAMHAMDSVLDHLRHTAIHPAGGVPGDACLLERFVAHGDEGAFAAIVRRHGGLVMGACRRLLGHQQDAEDAFQATFLILARRAATIAKRELLAPWLHSVACNTALKLRAATARRRTRETLVAAPPDVACSQPDPGATELQALLDQELQRLPRHYRVAIILCDLKQLPRRDAAQLLSCPEGSLSSRLARGRAMLAERLARRGKVGCAAALAAFFAGRTAEAAVAPATVAAAVRCLRVAAEAGKAMPGISPRVLELADGAVRSVKIGPIMMGLVGLLACLAAAMSGKAWQGDAAVIASRDARPPVQQAEPKAPVGGQNQTPAAGPRLDGRWAVEAIIVEGASAPAEILAKVVVEFSGDKMTIQPNISIDATEPAKPRFVLYEAPHPFRLKVTGSSAGTLELTHTDPNEKNEPFTMSFRLLGDTLVLFTSKGLSDKTPAEISAKKMEFGLMVLKRLGQAGEPGTPKATNTIQIKQAWDGILPKADLDRDWPARGVVGDTKTWARIWKAWRGGEKQPEIDFERQLVVVLQASGPNKIDMPRLQLDKTGNLTIPPSVSTLLPEDGRNGYKIMVIDRAAIKTIEGQPIGETPGKGGAAPEKGTRPGAASEGKRSARFLATALLLNPQSYDPPLTLTEQAALALLGDPDFVRELGAQQADGQNLDHVMQYLYLVDNSDAQTIPQEWKVAAGKTVAVSVTIRDGFVISTGWNAIPNAEAPPGYKKYQPLKTQ